jgi:hypothetical protein
MPAPLRAWAVVLLLVAAACSPAPPPPAGDATVPMGPDAIEGDF